jgi:hypothetical protein
VPAQAAEPFVRAFETHLNQAVSTVLVAIQDAVALQDANRAEDLVCGRLGDGMPCGREGHWGMHSMKESASHTGGAHGRGGD